ncbi:MAG: fused MFS/spermidine synthase [Nitrospirae bacterium]|nr:fused MFS/spermidine synthase [Nitrospirota bacterium]
MYFNFIIVASALMGYVSLSQEILWINVINYATGSDPRVFGHVLGCFLFGIAFGALTGKRLCEKEYINTITFVALVMSASSILYYLSVPAICKVMVYSKSYAMMFSYLYVAVIAFLSGNVFPILSHAGISQTSKVGVSVSWIYSANIVGSTIGPIITSFVLLDYFKIEHVFLFISIMTIVAALVFWIASPVKLYVKVLALLCLSIVSIWMCYVNGLVYVDIFEKLHYKESYNNRDPYKYIVQNRHGIVSVEGGKTDTLYGGGIYDGGFNLDPVLNTNGIARAYKIGALHPRPQSAFEIGLGSGSWAKAMLMHEDMRELIVTELNPAYAQLIRHYPDIADILDDPRMRIYYTDGRQWLKSNPDRKFDVILINVWHWRNFASHLLSVDFFEICKQHLTPGGILYVNTTGSREVVETVKGLFNHTFRFGSYVAGSDTSFIADVEEKRKNLLKFRLNGKPIFSPDDPRVLKTLNLLSADEFYVKPDFIPAVKPPIITDDNMAVEFPKTNNFGLRRNYK